MAEGSTPAHRPGQSGHLRCPRAWARITIRCRGGGDLGRYHRPREHPVTSIADPLLWGITIAAVVVLLGVDFLLTRRPHEVSTREAAGWSAFYVALPLAFGAWIW